MPRGPSGKSHIAIGRAELEIFSIKIKHPMKMTFYTPQCLNWQKSSGDLFREDEVD
jgi:hypothetical protein